jgi:hypothetical protein
VTFKVVGRGDETGDAFRVPFLLITRGAHPPPAGPTQQLSRVTPTAGGWRLSLTDEGRLTHLIPGGAQHLAWDLEPIHPLRVLQRSGHAHATEISRPIKGLSVGGSTDNGE